MPDQFFTIKEVAINNNCPECYSREGLQITFKQKFVDTFFYKAISTETAYSLFCNTCHTEIFPGRWTEDIDRVFEYHKKAMVPKPVNFKLKQWSWILIGITLALIILILVLVLI